MHKQTRLLPAPSLALRDRSGHGRSEVQAGEVLLRLLLVQAGHVPRLGGIRGRGPPDHTRGPLDFSEACVITAGLAGRARETILQMGRLRPTEGAWLAQDTLPEAGLD